MKKLLLIYNPISGSTKTRLSLQKAVEYYSDKDYIVTTCLTSRLYRYKDDIDFKSYDLIVCSGGDGTLNMTVSLLIDECIHKPIAYIPSGSTNDFGFSLGLSSNVDEMLKYTTDGKERNIDIGLFNNNRYFMYVAAFGALTKASYSASQDMKNKIGYMAYIIEGIKSITILRSYHAIVEIEDEIMDGEFILGMVTNSISIGGFRNVLPNDTELDDGKFEVILVKVPTSIDVLSEISNILMSCWDNIENNQHIIYRKASKIKITSTESIPWTLDGEFGGEEKDVMIENKTKLMSIIC